MIYSISSLSVKNWSKGAWELTGDGEIHKSWIEILRLSASALTATRLDRFDENLVTLGVGLWVVSFYSGRNLANQNWRDLLLSLMRFSITDIKSKGKARLL